jgi:hypothetical protein
MLDPGPIEQVVQSTCFNFTTNQVYLLFFSARVLFGKLVNLDVNAGVWQKCVPTN